jgi:hypothetical protein
MEGEHAPTQVPLRSIGNQGMTAGPLQAQRGMSWGAALADRAADRGVQGRARAIADGCFIDEQHVKFALAVADRYAVLKLGEIVDRGSVADPGAASDKILN